MSSPTNQPLVDRDDEKAQGDVTDTTTVAEGPFATAGTSAPVSSAPVSSTPVSSTPVSSTPVSTEADWRELQGRFVDDPEGATREAGGLAEKALSEFRSRSERGSTEELRNAFRRYRDLYTAVGSPRT